MKADELKAEIQRLKKLIKEVEYVEDDQGAFCPWCCSIAKGQRWGKAMRESEHIPSCQAFTETGEVR